MQKKLAINMKKNEPHRHTHTKDLGKKPKYKLLRVSFLLYYVVLNMDIYHLFDIDDRPCDVMIDY